MMAALHANAEIEHESQDAAAIPAQLQCADGLLSDAVNVCITARRQTLPDRSRNPYR